MTVTPQIRERLREFYLRRASRILFKQPFAIRTKVPLVSFTFDDFPRSALLTGGAILNEFGLAGTFYAAFGLMGKKAPAGEMFVPEDLKTLFDQGHELGCHTFDHCHSGYTRPDVFEHSIIRNQQALSELYPGASFRTLSYPISSPNPRTKRNASRH